MPRKGILDLCVVCGDLKEVFAAGKCARCYHRDYRKANLTRIRETQRRWYHANKPRFKERQQRYKDRLAKGLVKKP